MKDVDRRAVLAAIAGWEPIAPSVELTQHDRAEIRDQIAMEVAPALGIDGEAAMNRMQALRMAG